LRSMKRKNQVMSVHHKKNLYKEKEIQLRHQTSRGVRGKQVYHASPKDERPSQLKDKMEEETSEPLFRRSKRTQKQNPKYANAVLVEGSSITEPSTYE